MKKHCFAAALVIVGGLVSGHAIAADLPAAVSYKAAPVVATNWTGFYVGGNVGAASSRNKWYDVFTQQPISTDTASGITGGLQVGFDWQFAPAWVIGIQGMFNWANARSDVGQDVQCTNCGLVDHSKLSSFQTMTGRLGYLIQPNFLVYAKGGAAWAHNRNSQTEPGGFFWPLSSTRQGYDAGGGLEWMFTPGWSAFVEYNYANFGTFTSDDGFTKITQDVQTVLIGASYHFGGGR